MKILSFLSFIFGMISFAFQMYDVFPRYQETFEKLSFVLLGIFIGSIISYFNKNQVKITKLSTVQTFIYIFFIIIGIVFLVLVGTMVVSDNKEKISIVQTVLFWLGAFTILALATLGSSLSIDRDTTTLDEKLMLARHYHALKHFGKAIYFYKKAIESLDEADDRGSGILAKLEALKLEQVADQSNNLS